MTSYARVSGSSAEELVGPFSVTVGGVVYDYPDGAASILDGAGDLPENIAAIVEAGPKPAGVRILGQALTVANGVPTRVWQTVAYTVDEARALAWERVKELRETKANGSAATPFGHRADSDSDSRLRISGAVQLADKAAAAGLPFAISWTMADNAMVPLDAAGMSALGIAVGQHYAACYTRAQELRTEITASVDPLAIDIDAGWPA